MDFSDLHGGRDEKQSQALSRIKAQEVGKKNCCNCWMRMNDFNSL